MPNNPCFEVLIDDSLLNLLPGSNSDNSNFQNYLLNFINGFEDGSWRYELFTEFIWDNIKETALSAEERNKLINAEMTSLRRSASNLRLTSDNDIGKGGEIAEILLYGILKHHFNALPVIPKIFYKQNANDPAKGADSVHLMINRSNGDFSLWLGEAKFYNKIDNTRLGSIVDSVKNLLDSEKLRKENSLITGLQELDNLDLDEALVINIKEQLSHGVSLDDIKKRLHVPILLLHECELTQNHDQMSNEYREAIKAYHIDRAKTYMEKQTDKLSESIHGYEDITFHIIIFPVPNKNAIVESFTTMANSLRTA